MAHVGPPFQAFDLMLAAGLGNPDAVVYNSLLEVLWQSGSLLAQVKAMQLWSLATMSGHFRWMGPSNK